MQRDGSEEYSAGKKQDGRAYSREEKSEKKKQELIAAPADDGQGITFTQKMQIWLVFFRQ